MRRFLTATVLGFALAAAAPAQAAPIWDHCKTSATGWGIWVNENAAGCAFARVAYRRARAYQRAHGGIAVGERFVLRKVAGAITLRCRTFQDYEAGIEFTIRCRERGTPLAMFDYPY